MTVQDLMPEQLGPYRLVQRLGEGGMGIVYLARDSSERMVAVKALRSGVAAEPTARRRLAREVETMRRVRSPHVAEVIDADTTGDPPYIVTRFVPGRTLEEVVAERGPLAGAALARLASGLAGALAAVHAAGVVHRDLKPGNVMLVDGEPVVIDFGIAQLPETTRLTMTGMFMGTPGYLAPEVIEGRPSGPEADVHSWGATMAFAATGRPPFGTGSFEAIFYRIMHGQPDLGSCPVPLLTLIASALARDPARRPSAAQLSEGVAAINPAALVPGAAAGLSGRRDGAVPDGRPGGAVPDRASPAGTRADLPDRAPQCFPAAPLAVGLAGGAAAAGGAGSGWPSGTRPLASDFRDLLPPVSYGPAAAPAGSALDRAAPGAAAAYQGGGAGYPGGAGYLGGAGYPGGAGHPAGDGLGAAPGRPAARAVAGRRPVSGWSLPVIAVLATAVALSVAFPLAGTAVAVAFLIAASAAGRTGQRIARRRSRSGGGPADLALAAALFPLALCRAAIRFVLLAPLAVLGGLLVAAAAIIGISAHPLPHAFALGAGALTAVYGFGPASAASRGPLASWLRSDRSQLLTVIAFVSVTAAAGAMIVLAVSQPPSFWPAASPGAQLLAHPAVHSMLHDMFASVLTLARHFGL